MSKTSGFYVLIGVLVILPLITLTGRIVFTDRETTQPDESAVTREEGVAPVENSGSTDFSTSNIFDLTNTPVQTQKTLAFLLLVPVGLLITVLARSLAGIRFLGTFSPTILALSQVKSNYKIGICIFFITFGLGTLCRKLLVKYKLSTVSRRGATGTFVVLVIAITIYLFHSMDLAPIAKHVLLPVAIMTMMIDSFFTIMQKEGNRTALSVLANSLLVAVCCFLIFVYTPAGMLLLSYPEIELFILAAMLIVGRYSGRTLMGFLGLDSKKKHSRVSG